MPTIPELEKLGGLPNSSEWVLPVCWDDTAEATRSISIDELVKSIKDAVLEGGEVEMYEYGLGLKFRHTRLKGWTDHEMKLAGWVKNEE